MFSLCSSIHRWGGVTLLTGPLVPGLWSQVFSGRKGKGRGTQPVVPGPFWGRRGGVPSFWSQVPAGRRGYLSQDQDSGTPPLLQTGPGQGTPPDKTRTGKPPPLALSPPLALPLSSTLPLLRRTRHSMERLCNGRYASCGDAGVLFDIFVFIR